MPKGKARVITGTGDTGYTSLLGKTRVPKYNSRIEALGTLDEASSGLGLARATCRKSIVKDIVYELQRDLYKVMAELATPPENYERVGFKVRAEDVQRLEHMADDVKARVAIQDAFIIPGNTPGGAALDLARCIIRRAERQVALLAHTGEVSNGELLRFLNRLSDVVFILARFEEEASEQWSAKRTA